MASMVYRLVLRLANLLEMRSRLRLTLLVEPLLKGLGLLLALVAMPRLAVVPMLFMC